MSEENIDFSWAALGACRNVDTSVFYPEHATPRMAMRIREAKQICLSCSVRLECLEYALKYETVGIWGGLTESERRRTRRSSNIRLQRERFGLQHFLPMDRQSRRTDDEYAN